MIYDLIIVTQSSPELIPITQRCIDSARADTKDINVIIVETGEVYKYDFVDTFIKYEGVFNYNRALNMGLSHTKGDVFILANNDLIFHPGWSLIGELMRLNGYHSASAKAGHQKQFQAGDFLYEGYHVSITLTGWCIFLDKFCLDKIGSLDETCSFWFSDDLYGCQIRAAGIKHALFCNCRVDHIASQTINRQRSRIKHDYQIGETRKYVNRQRYYAEAEIMYKAYPADIQA
jgi:glycosyltransferase involved in cell wall biosynthesis